MQADKVHKERTGRAGSLLVWCIIMNIVVRFCPDNNNNEVVSKKVYLTEGLSDTGLCWHCQQPLHSRLDLYHYWDINTEFTFY